MVVLVMHASDHEVVPQALEELHAARLAVSL